jgi:hypothetical protein
LIATGVDPTATHAAVRRVDHGRVLAETADLVERPVIRAAISEAVSPPVGHAMPDHPTIARRAIMLVGLTDDQPVALPPTTGLLAVEDVMIAAGVAGHHHRIVHSKADGQDALAIRVLVMTKDKP